MKSFYTTDLCYVTYKTYYKVVHKFPSDKRTVFIEALDVLINYLYIEHILVFHDLSVNNG